MFKIYFNNSIIYFYLIGFIFTSNINLFAQVFDGFQTINHNQIDRRFYLYVPDNYSVNTPIPILFNFHGGGGDPVSYMNYTSDMRGLAETNNFILIYPEAIADPSTGSISWIDKATGGSPRDETLFIDAIINLIDNNYSVDLDRIYACGYSEGGIFSYELACRLNNRISGIASVSGSMLSESERSNLGFSNCSPEHPTAIMLIPGTSDTNAHSLYEGCCLDWGLDSYYLSANQITDYWTNYNSTDSNPSVSDVSNTNTTDGSTVERKIWSNGQGSVEVQELKIIGGGHEWPGTSGNMDINANIEIWQFLSKFDKNGMIDNFNFDEIQSSVSVSPNPFNNYFKIEGAENGSIGLYDLLGRKVKYRAINNTIYTEELKSGVYFLVIREKNISFKLVKS